jgi:hypothetical protein
MRKIAFIGSAVLAFSILLSFIIIHMVERAAPQNVKFMYASILDAFTVNAVISMGLIILFSFILFLRWIMLKRLQWGKGKTSLFCLLELFFVLLIILLAYGYSIKMTALVPTGLSATPALISLKAFIFYLAKRIILFGAILHFVVFVVIYLLFKKKKQSRPA